MRKIFSLIILMLVAVFTLSSCVGKTTGPIGGNGGNGDTPDGQNPDDDDDLITYTVSLYRNNQIWIPNMDIKAVFVNDYSVSEVQIDDFYGVATFKGDGDYNVHLSAVPQGYTYDPNIYTVDPQHTDLIIDLYPISNFDSGTGSGPYNPEAYDISKTGYYKVELSSINDRKYFHFLPTQSGEYAIESICDIYTDDIDPIGIKYTGNEQFISEEYGSIVYQDGGVSLESGFTSNFKFSLTFDVTELNVAKVFAIEAESKSETYPAVVYFKVEYVDSYSRGPGFNPIVVEPQEASIDVTPKEPGTLHWLTDLNGGVLDVRNYAYNEADGFWHVYDKEKYKSTNGYGPTLVCRVNINMTIPALGFSISEALAAPAGATFLCLSLSESESYCYDYFLYGRVESDGVLQGPVFNEDGSKLDYQGDCYMNYANSEGMVYVTNELMEFWQLFSNCKGYFFDGNGHIELQTNSYGEHISAGQDDQWLFACGYYE